MKHLLFILSGLVIPGLLFAQSRLMTMEEATLGTGLTARNLSQLQWNGDDNSWFYVAKNSLVKGYAGNARRDTVLRLTELNLRIKEAKEDTLPKFPSVTAYKTNVVSFTSKNKFYTYGLADGILQKLNSWPEKSENTDMSKVALLKPELTPRIDDLLANYNKFSDGGSPVIFIELYRVNDKDYQIYMAVFSDNFFEQFKYESIPIGFFDFKHYKVFVFGELPGDLFSKTINKETFCYFYKPKIIPRKVSSMPYPPAVSTETTTWVYNFKNGNISLDEKIMGSW